MIRLDLKSYLKVVKVKHKVQLIRLLLGPITTESSYILISIIFSKQPPTLDPLIINGSATEVVKSAKLLGFTISNDLTWDKHVDNVIKKVNKRVYFLIQLKRAKVPPKGLSLFYVTCIRSVMDYGVVSYVNSLPEYLKYQIARVEKTAI